MSDINEKEKVNATDAPAEQETFLGVEMVSTEKQQEVLDKYENDTVAEATGKAFHIKLVDAIILVMTLYVLYTCAFGVQITSVAHHALFMAMIWPCVFLTYPANKKHKYKTPKWFDWVFAVCATACGLYITFNIYDINMRQQLPNKFEYVVFFILLVCVLEAVRRVTGKTLLIVIFVFLFYAFFGRVLPYPFKHVGISLRRCISQLMMNPEGIFGNSVGVAASTIALFVIFGSFLEKTGVGQFLIDLGTSVAGHLVGGPAKVSVIVSALFGTVSGNAVSNVVTTGSFTIPLMKSIGYDKEFAAAVEAVSSTAGQLMPPIMGSSAFLMASVLGISYGKVCLAAIVPVLLYYVGAFTMIHMRAEKLNLKGIPREELPVMKTVIKERGYLSIPFLFVIAMLIMNFTVKFVGVLAIIVAIVVAGVKKETRLSFKDIINCLILGGRRVMSIAASCAGIGIIVGVCSMTGLVQTIGRIIVSLGGGLFLPTLLIVAALGIVMGMGLSTATVYMLLSTVAAPSLVSILHLPHLAAHMFVFYFGLLACLTPPVCIPAYAAAGLADADPNKVGWQSFKLAAGGFIVPFLFAYSPDILFINATAAVIPKIITSLLGVFLIGVCVEGWFMGKMPVWLRILGGVGACLMILPETITDIAGIVAFILIVIVQKKNSHPAIS